ncbi:hypothetical protein F5Y11DRAFT_319513 [Daldinia sp. FL1419]|nr:hypothetical protein F5Y11DRAFT_319513 [Daldinia sp. FL1419]
MNRSCFILFSLTPVSTNLLFHSCVHSRWIRCIWGPYLVCAGVVWFIIYKGRVEIDSPSAGAQDEKRQSYLLHLDLNHLQYLLLAGWSFHFISFSISVSILVLYYD